MNNLETKVVDTSFEPKTQNRFIVECRILPGYVIKSIQKPKLNVPTENEAKVWHSMKMEVYDPIEPSSTECIWKQLNSGNIPFLINIKLLNPTGTDVAEIVEEWDINDAKISFVDFGNLDWSADSEPNIITIILNYKDATLKSK